MKLGLYLSSGLVSLDLRAKSKLVSYVMDTPLTSVNITNIVRSDGTSVASGLLTSVYGAMSIFYVVSESIVSVVLQTYYIAINNWKFVKCLTYNCFDFEIYFSTSTLTAMRERQILTSRTCVYSIAWRYDIMHYWQTLGQTYVLLVERVGVTSNRMNGGCLWGMQGNGIHKSANGDEVL